MSPGTNRGIIPLDISLLREGTFMKKLIVGLMVVTALAACGKKGKGSSASGPAPGPGAGAAGACSLNAQGQCVGGVNFNTGFVGLNTWVGNVGVTNQQKFIEFMTANGLCYGIQCTRAYSFFELQVRTVRETLPGMANFAITPLFDGFPGRSLNTRAQAFLNGGNNGFQLVYNRSAYGYGGGYQYGGGNYYGRPVMPYGPYGTPGAPGVNPAIANQNTAVQIVLTYRDATGTIADVAVLYQGVQIGSGQVMAQYPMNGQLGGPVPANPNAPAVAPFRERY